MAIHILGKAIKGKKPIHLGLASTFYGIGVGTAQKICAKLGFYPQMQIHQLSENQILNITKELSGMTIEKQLLEETRSNIKMKKDIGSYAGMRHAMGLPVRGQKTKNNIATARKLNRINRKQ
ncbi:hypothetical protein BABINDRAFT_50762 [Babjeviella inositovora NRRL Y-12698]|uniref:Small ribosomal subunit protein uS13m n=1 Tax=Babjeviella inositovora NRRL Y-12698 TaxID=984486 RepID=A0A1E3QPJ9_9ASCO|nr:uncharacterized protein BABINDRAFT_50762 [Babjeviella inositovora NRRL Y-12698]ODQ78992.1 hypothetical protein BABINDRAFT_50762 [Babjeviella inositovora NRRL Y-12698]